MPETYVKRITLFKVPKDDDIEKVLKQYEILRKTAVKVHTTPPTFRTLHQNLISPPQALLSPSPTPSPPPAYALTTQLHRTPNPT